VHQQRAIFLVVIAHVLKCVGNDFKNI